MGVGTMRALTITASDRDWHEAFHDYVARVFPGVSFRHWAAWGGWQENYRVFALLEANRILAGAALTRMDVVLQGQVVRGFQLGAVGTDPDYRGQGLQRRVMQHVLAQVDAEDLVFLFANERVLDFYPRFGFRREREHVFTAQHRAQPAGTQLRVLSPEAGADRALLARVAAMAEPATTRFGARDYGSILLWYFCNFHSEHVSYVPEHEALIVAEQQGSTLFVYDVLAEAAFDLVPYVPQLIRTEIERLEFHYLPERDWPSALATREYVDSPLFVRGPQLLPPQPFKFPALAQT